MFLPDLVMQNIVSFMGHSSIQNVVRASIDGKTGNIPRTSHALSVSRIIYIEWRERLALDIQRVYRGWINGRLSYHGGLTAREKEAILYAMASDEYYGMPSEGDYRNRWARGGELFDVGSEY